MISDLVHLAFMIGRHSADDSADSDDIQLALSTVNHLLTTYDWDSDDEDGECEDDGSDDE